MNYEESEVYRPREDSRLLRDSVIQFGVGESFLEIGCGSTFNLKGLTEKFRLVVGTDILTLKTTTGLKNRGEFELVIADKASCFKDETFDFIAFNPPYLPSQKIDDLCTDGGKGGMQVPISFLSDALRVKKRNGKIVMILSNENDLTILDSFCIQHHLKQTLLFEKGVFFERLYSFLIEEQN